MKTNDDYVGYIRCRLPHGSEALRILCKRLKSLTESDKPVFYTKSWNALDQADIYDGLDCTKTSLKVLCQQILNSTNDPTTWVELSLPVQFSVEDRRETCI